MSVGRYKGITTIAISKLPLRMLNVKLAAIEPIKLKAGVPIKRLRNNQMKDSIGRLRIKANNGDKSVNGSPVVNQWATIFIKTIISMGSEDKDNKSNVPSSKSSRKNLSRAIRTDNNEPTQSIPGAIFARSLLSKPSPTGNRSTKTVKKLTTLVMAPPVLKISFNSHFRYASAGPITIHQKERDLSRRFFASFYFALGRLKLNELRECPVYRE